MGTQSGPSLPRWCCRRAKHFRRCSNEVQPCLFLQSGTRLHMLGARRRLRCRRSWITAWMRWTLRRVKVSSFTMKSSPWTGRTDLLGLYSPRITRCSHPDHAALSDRCEEWHVSVVFLVRRNVKKRQRPPGKKRVPTTEKRVLTPEKRFPTLEGFEGWAPEGWGARRVELWPRFEAVAHPKCAFGLPGDIL